ncbi:MAG: two pore domain potassium channel family protein [Fimbriimonadaceae bacterium]|nr:two pore domain potassium channel family protein [Fimbriimonadaceae bacterium]
MGWKPYTEIKLSQRGWITPAIGHVLTAATYPSLLLKRGFMGLGRALGMPDNVLKPAMTDAMVFTLLVATGACTWWVETHPAGSTFSQIALWYAVWRIVDIVCTAGRIVLFDPYKTHYTSEYKISSTVRSIILGFINYLELIFAFAIVYQINRNLIGPPWASKDTLSSLYLSAVTQLTVGYGDLRPTGVLRLIASLQAFFGLALLSLFVARFISLLRPISSLDEDDED